MAPKKSTKPSTSTSTAPSPPSTSAPPPPNWPPLLPLLPPSSLSLVPSPTLPTQILTIPQFFTPTLCKTYVSFLSTLPLTTTPGGLNPKKGNAVRVNDRFQVHDPGFAEKLWREGGLRELVMGDAAVEEEGDNDAGEGEEPGEGEGRDRAADEEERKKRRELLYGGEVLGLNPNIRIYRYTPGQFFAPHYDESNDVSFVPSTPTTSSSSPAKTIPGRTTWTFLLYLTSSSTGCVGGETVFYPDPIHVPGAKTKSKPDPVVVTLETGLALLHKHGRDCMVHEGRAVTAGEKWVVRSDLVVRR